MITKSHRVIGEATLSLLRAVEDEYVEEGVVLYPECHLTTTNLPKPLTGEHLLTFFHHTIPTPWKKVN